MSANIYDWSTTAANNSNSDGDLTWAEGQAPSTVNNSARVMMQRVKQLLVDIGGSIAAGGTANGLTVTASNAFTAYADGMIIAFRATASNSAAATLNVNGIGAKAIQKMDSTGDVALVANEIRNTGVYIAQYQAALNGAAGAWLLLNPTLSSALYALAGLVTVDNTVPRFDGLVGKIQTSGVVISDTNAVSGIVGLTVTGGGSLTGTWTNMGTVTTIDIKGGTIDGAAIGGSSAAAISGTTGTFSSTLSASSLTSGNGQFIATAGGVTLVPNPGDSNQNTSIDGNGNMTVRGTLTVTG